MGSRLLIDAAARSKGRWRAVCGGSVLVLSIACGRDDDSMGADDGQDTGGVTITASGGEKFDVAGGDLGGAADDGGCGGGGDVEFSYIWIANSPESTVSKIDTRTLTEVGRYLVSGTGTGQPSAGPSRTSVNLDGDVAVADRDGAMVKILARPDECPDVNGTPGVQTSTGPQDVLPWGEDECVVWRTELQIDARPAAWASGDKIGACTYEARLWASAPDADDSGAATVYLLDGEDGTILKTAEIAAADCNCPVFGLYGGAVDANNTFWSFPRDGNPHGTGPLIRVDYDTLAYDVYPKPEGLRAYGIAVDRDGRVWIAGDDSSLGVFDPVSTQWVVVDPQLGSDEYVLRGLMQDGDGHIWVAALNGWDQNPAFSPGLLRVDAPATTIVDFIDTSVLTGLQKPAGTSIDVDGHVWLVDTDGNQAFRVDPVTYDAQIVGGLNLPYTYSDMTGFGLKNVVGPPQG